MKCSELFKQIEKRIPPAIAWQRDNVGLQVGDPDSEILKILITLDPSPEAVREAIEKGANLIISHHPLLFNPLKQINTSGNHYQRTTTLLIKNDITLYSAHTNFDSIPNGVSFSLAQKLGLTNISVLNRTQETHFKLLVYVPTASHDTVAKALFASGAGVIGNYENCSFSTAGTGTFKGTTDSNPTIGTQDNLETVEEIKLEVVVPRWLLKSVLSSLKQSHPYEEPAYDVYPLQNSVSEFGLGAIGEYEEAIEPYKFLDIVSSKLNCKGLRYTQGKQTKIKRVAVLGGSGSNYHAQAVSARADAFVTADVTYHSFLDSEKSLWFIDAGHFETEFPALESLKKIIQTIDSSLEVLITDATTFPISYHNDRRS